MARLRKFPRHYSHAVFIAIANKVRNEIDDKIIRKAIVKRLLNEVINNKTSWYNWADYAIQSRRTLDQVIDTITKYNNDILMEIKENQNLSQS